MTPAQHIFVLRRLRGLQVAAFALYGLDLLARHAFTPSLEIPWRLVAAALVATCARDLAHVVRMGRSRDDDAVESRLRRHLAGGP